MMVHRKGHNVLTVGLRKYSKRVYRVELRSPENVAYKDFDAYKEPDKNRLEAVKFFLQEKDRML